MPGMDGLFGKLLFVWMTGVEELKDALKKFVNFRFAHFMRCQEIMQIKIRKSAIRYARWKEFAQAARFKRAERANLLEDHTPEWILESRRIQEPADFHASTRLNEHGAKKS